MTPSVRITTAISNRRSTGFRDGRSDTTGLRGASKDSYLLCHGGASSKRQFLLATLGPMQKTLLALS